MGQQPGGVLRRAFNLWERTAAAYLEALVRNPLFLGANGALLGWLLTLRRVADEASQMALAAAGLPTRRDQERALHLLQTIEGRLDDLEARLEQPASGTAPPASRHGGR